MCCPCYMPKYVPRLEGIMHDPKVSRSCSTCVIRCATIKRHKHQSNSYRFRSRLYCWSSHSQRKPYIYLLTLFKTIFFTLILMFVSHSWIIQINNCVIRVIQYFPQHSQSNLFIFEIHCHTYIFNVKHYTLTVFVGFTFP